MIQVVNRVVRRSQAISRGHWIIGSVLLFLGISLALHLPGFIRPLFNSDEASLATMAMVIDRGGTLYHETADRKPPAVPYVYAAVFAVTGSTDIRPVRAVAAVAMAGTAFLLGMEALRRTGSRTRALGCGLLFLAGTAALFPADSQAAGFEMFMLLPLTASVVMAGMRRAVLAGMLLAVACLCKQTAVLTALPIAYVLYREAGFAALLRAAAAAAAVVTVTALYFGVEEFMLWTFTGNGGYVTLKGSVLSSVGRGLAMSIAFVVCNVTSIWCLRRAWVDRRVSVDLWLWLAGAAFAVLVGFRFFGHYYLQLAPPLALAAAVGLPAFPRCWRLLLAGVLAPVCAMWLFSFSPPNARGIIAYGDVADTVRTLTDATDRIFVWGEYPEIYWAAGREPATRFIHTGFITGNSPARDPHLVKPSDGIPGAWELLEEDFREHPPDLVVDTSSASIRKSEFYPLESTRLWSDIATRYELVAVVSDVRLFKLETSRG